MYGSKEKGGAPQGVLDLGGAPQGALDAWGTGDHPQVLQRADTVSTDDSDMMDEDGGRGSGDGYPSGWQAGMSMDGSSPHAVLDHRDGMHTGEGGSFPSSLPGSGIASAGTGERRGTEASEDASGWRKHHVSRERSRQAKSDLDRKGEHHTHHRFRGPDNQLLAVDPSTGEVYSPHDFRSSSAAIFCKWRCVRARAKSKGACLV